MGTIFQFKQFEIRQDQCAMKIGTDAVLLGAWTNLNFNPQNILDVGAGTGVIALMMAQRCLADLIDAIELDANAYEQCVDNFENSLWSDRLFCYHADFREFVQEMEEPYDLVISNPPFFETPIKEMGISSERQKARFTESLSFGELIEGVSMILDEEGQFSTIIPFVSEEEFIKIAQSFDLYPNRITRVRGRKETPIKRSLIQLGFDEQTLVEDEMTIELERHLYTDEYIQLTQDFYLKM